MNSIKKYKYELLTARKILDILDGDTKFGKYTFEDGTFVEIAMPYLSGYKLCEISTQFGLPVRYPAPEKPSRWCYLQNLLNYCCSKGTCSALLAYLFSKQQFSDVLDKRYVTEIKVVYKEIGSKILSAINGELYFSDCELVVVGGEFIVREKGVVIEIHAPKIKVIDNDYIKVIRERAMQNIEIQDYESVITKSRTLIEDVFCYIIEKNNEKPECKGDIKKLHKQVKSICKMHYDDNIDNIIKRLLSGLETVIDSIAEFRNKNSDSHGVGSSRRKLEKAHAVLAINSAVTVAEFIISVAEAENKI